MKNTLTDDQIRIKISEFSKNIEKYTGKWNLYAFKMSRFYTRIGGAMFLYSTVLLYFENTMSIYIAIGVSLNIFLALGIMLYRPDGYTNHQELIFRRNEDLHKDIALFVIECQKQKNTESEKELERLCIKSNTLMRN